MNNGGMMTQNESGDPYIYIYRFIYYTNSSSCIIILHNLMNLDDHEFFLPAEPEKALAQQASASLAATCLGNLTVRVSITL